MPSAHQERKICCAQLIQRVRFSECRFESLAVCMPHMDKQCGNFNAMDLSLNTRRQRLRCAWALTSRGFEDQCFVTITCDQKHGPEDEVSSSPLIKLQ